MDPGCEQLPQIWSAGGSGAAHKKTRVPQSSYKTWRNNNEQGNKWVIREYNFNRVPAKSLDHVLIGTESTNVHVDQSHTNNKGETNLHEIRTKQRSDPQPGIALALIAGSGG